ncbi:transferase family-domain-containing protein [Dactylonectria macrodidyma]|uniref:Transferase family-domain-containing protein n=1 Tax=Dactylonectria macrodidyma TaxID=307937 RepID=A0A9P9ESA2_9HYPO|nr:transferase family-domain-containing protein [Dactylonectria macrodidyma]
MDPSIVHTTLNPLDHLPPRQYTGFVFYLPLKPGVEAPVAFSALQHGLHKTFQQLPWLSGKVAWQAKDTPGWRPGQLEIQHSPATANESRPHQLTYNELDSSLDYSDLKASGFPANAVDDNILLPFPFFPDISVSADVFVAQANFIPGACLLACATVHSACDGTAVLTIFNLWADHCRKILDRIWAKDAVHKSPSEVDPATWQLLSLPPPGTNMKPPLEHNLKPESNVSGKKTLKTSIFYIPSSHFTALKKEYVHQPGTDRVSGNDMALGFIWRSLTKAQAAVQEFPENTTAILDVPIDGRPDYSLPSTYLGSIVLVNRVTLPLSTLTSTGTSFAEVGQAIRGTFSTISPAVMLDAYTLIKTMPDYTVFDLRTHPIDGANLMVSSLLTLPAHVVSFGDEVFANGGKPETARPLMSGFNKQERICFVLPPKSHGGIEIVVSLFEDEMGKLLEDEDFGKYAMFLS